MTLGFLSAVSSPQQILEHTSMLFLVSKRFLVTVSLSILLNLCLKTIYFLLSLPRKSYCFFSLYHCALSWTLTDICSLLDTFMNKQDKQPAKISVFALCDGRGVHHPEVPQNMDICPSIWECCRQLDPTSVSF